MAIKFFKYGILMMVMAAAQVCFGAAAENKTQNDNVTICLVNETSAWCPLWLTANIGPYHVQSGWPGNWLGVTGRYKFVIPKTEFEKTARTMQIYMPYAFVLFFKPDLLDSVTVVDKLKVAVRTDEYCNVFIHEEEWGCTKDFLSTSGTYPPKHGITKIGKISKP